MLCIDDLKSGLLCFIAFYCVVTKRVTIKALFLCHHNHIELLSSGCTFIFPQSHWKVVPGYKKTKHWQMIGVSVLQNHYISTFDKWKPISLHLDSITSQSSATFESLNRQHNRVKKSHRSLLGMWMWRTAAGMKTKKRLKDVKDQVKWMHVL